MTTCTLPIVIYGWTADEFSARNSVREIVTNIDEISLNPM